MNLMYADGHVHFRDFSQSNVETVAHGLEVARDSGVVLVGDMPNTNPLITNRETLKARIKLAKEAKIKGVRYMVNLGLTANPEQIKEVVSLSREFRESVLALKLFAGPSTGDLNVQEEHEQYLVYETLANEGFEGVVYVHADKESCMQRHLWNPKKPETHGLAQPPEAEVESIKDQIRLSEEAGYKSGIHIAHISYPESVQLVNDAKQKGVNISSGICPHHFIYSLEDMGREGMFLKMNPALRPYPSNVQMLEDLRTGRIDFVETDHAPHTLESKNNCASGIPALPWWPLFAEYLRRQDFTEIQVEDVTFNNFQRRLDVDIPRVKAKLKDHRKDYEFNPHYNGLERELGVPT